MSMLVSIYMKLISKPNDNEPKSRESHVSVSVVVVILVRWVDADSVEVLIVELAEEFMTMALGVVEELLVVLALFNLLVLAVLK